MVDQACQLALTHLECFSHAFGCYQCGPEGTPVVLSLFITMAASGVRRLRATTPSRPTSVAMAIYTHMYASVARPEPPKPRLQNGEPRDGEAPSSLGLGLRSPSLGNPKPGVVFEQHQECII